MEHRNIGRLSVSLVGIGCNNFGWRIDAEQTKSVVDASIASGINFFDTADFYGAGDSERFLGQALGSRRKDVIVATKFGLAMGEGKQGGKASYVKEACEASLARLGTDYIDLYQFHRPDPDTPLAETIGALHELIDEGKVREVGCSNFGPDLLQDSAALGARWRSVQNHYSMLQRAPEEGVLAECERQGLGFLPYFPLENGLLSGKYSGGAVPDHSRAKDGFGPQVFTPANLAKAAALDGYAKSKGHTLLELAFSWLASKAVISSIIAGAKNESQVRANVAAPGWRLTADDLKAVEAIL